MTISHGKSPSLGNIASLRGWLEDAISSSKAELVPGAPPTPASTRFSEAATETVVEKKVGGHRRKLVTVRCIEDLTDLSVDHMVATIDGWKVVVKRNRRFRKGDLVLFLEVDSFLPAGSRFESLFAQVGPLTTFGNEEGYRVGTSVWTGLDKNEIISQGHIFHLADFTAIDEKVRDMHWAHVEARSDESFLSAIRDIDFSEHLGVKKWESHPDKGEDEVGVPTSNPKKPSFVLKTDMERAQNCPNLFSKPKYQRFVFQESLKMDGASTTVYFVPRGSPYFSTLPPLPTLDHHNAHTALRYAVHPAGRFGVCTRNLDLLPHLIPSKEAPAHGVFWAAALAAGLHRILPALDQAIAVQAELVGATVQDNPYGYPRKAAAPANAGAEVHHELFVFSVIDIATQTRWAPQRVEEFAARHGLRHVPVLGYHTIPSIARHHQDLLDRAELKKGEGLVFKNCTDGRWFKVLSNRWILEKGDEARARKAAAAAAAAAAKARPATAARPVTAPTAAATGGAPPTPTSMNGANGAAGRKNEGAKAAKAEEGDKKDVSGGWTASAEEAEKIMNIFRDLEEWMRRDDGLKKWMEEWERGWRGEGDQQNAGQQNAGQQNAGQQNGAGHVGDGRLDSGASVSGVSDDAVVVVSAAHARNHTTTTPTTTTTTTPTTTDNNTAADRGTANPSGSPTAKHDANGNANKTTGFGFPPEKRKELAAWLGLDGSAL